MRDIECAAEVRLVADPEYLTSKAGKPYARFRACVGEGDATQWLQVNAVGPKALESMAGLVKSDRAYVEGSIKLDRWQAQDGTERSGLGVLAWKVVPGRQDRAPEACQGCRQRPRPRTRFEPERPPCVSPGLGQAELAGYWPHHRRAAGRWPTAAQ
jgi:hypothetical protein